ncbi:MAG: LysR family transcriptional regulator [Mucilaginibacter sp.]|uniref:LysR family transcriptional regulator n=1 Tax=Mucilaginibacter sp. TaxID=1882438 RepID=UPI003267651D
MDIQQIRNFIALSKELHFWRTASMMNITQSALSRQIQAMEEELGVSLFERNKRNVSLTPSGIFLKEKWSVILEDLDHVHTCASKISKGETGHIRIAHPDSISSSIIPHFMGTLGERHPEITVELVQLLYKNIEESLQDHKLDMAFTRQLSKLPGICSHMISRQPVALFVPESSDLSRPEDITGAALKEQTFILPVAERQSRFYFFVQEIMESYGVVPRACYFSDFGSSLLGLVSRGLGMAILPGGFVHHGFPGVRAIEMPFHSELYICWRADEKSPSIMNATKVLSELFPVTDAH